MGWSGIGGLSLYASLILGFLLSHFYGLSVVVKHNRSRHKSYSQLQSFTVRVGNLS
jgi:hypothetical protein